jgi:Family of unknown function (DUF5309)
MAATLITSQTGIRQDLSDLIAVVDAKTCPVISMAKKGAEPINPLTQWQADAFNAATVPAGVLSNTDVSSSDFVDNAENRVLLSARIQKFREVPSVDDLAQHVSEVAGIGKKKEMARAVSKSLEQMKRSMEAAFCSDQEGVEQSGATPYKTRGLGKWIQNGAQSDLPVNAAYRTPTASINTTVTASLTENNIQDMLQSLYEQTGKSQTYSLVCGPALKRQFTSFTRTQFASTNVASAIRVLNQKDSSKIVSSVDIFEGDFGTLELIPSLFLAKDATVNAAAVQNGRGYVLDMDMVELRYNRKPRFQELEDRGGGPRGIVDAICALCVKSPLALGKFAPTA